MRAFLRTTLIAAATAGLVGAGTPALAAPEGSMCSMPVLARLTNDEAIRRALVAAEIARTVS